MTRLNSFFVILTVALAIPSITAVAQQSNVQMSMFASVYTHIADTAVIGNHSRAGEVVLNITGRFTEGKCYSDTPTAEQLDMMYIFGVYPFGYHSIQPTDDYKQSTCTAVARGGVRELNMNYVNSDSVPIESIQASTVRGVEIINEAAGGSIIRIYTDEVPYTASMLYRIQIGRAS